MQRICVASTSILRRLITWRKFSKVGWANIRSLAFKGPRRSNIGADAALWRRTGVSITSIKIWYELVLIHSLRKSKFILYNCTWIPMSEGCDAALLRRIDVNITSFDNPMTCGKIFRWLGGANISSLALGTRQSKLTQMQRFNVIISRLINHANVCHPLKA